MSENNSQNRIENILDDNPENQNFTDARLYDHQDDEKLCETILEVKLDDQNFENARLDAHQEVNETIEEAEEEKEEAEEKHPTVRTDVWHHKNPVAVTSAVYDKKKKEEDRQAKHQVWGRGQSWIQGSRDE